MIRFFSTAMMTLALCWPALAIEQRHDDLVGMVQRLDSATKTAVIKLADGTEHTLHIAKRTVVHGAEAVGAGAKDAFHGLKEGTEVAVHYTAKGTVETAEEIDNIGKSGLKATEATITHVDKAAKTMTVKTADGVEDTYRLSANAAKDLGKDIETGADKSVKATVYYSEEAGHKVAHFCKKVIM